MASIYDINNWAPGSNYDLNDIVSQSNRYLYCTSANNSSSLDTSRNFGGYYKINSIELPYFLWKPSYSSQVTFRPKLKKTRFGDNYEQRIKSVIDNNLLEFNLTFEKRNDKEARAILHFLNERKGAGIFYWLPYSPFAETRMFICSEWNNTRNFVDNNTITAKFIEKPYLLTLSLPVLPPIDPPPLPSNILLDLVLHWNMTEGTTGLRSNLPSNKPSYLLRFFRMQSSPFTATEMPRSDIAPQAFVYSSQCPIINKNIPSVNIWYKHPWGGVGMTGAESSLVNVGDTNFTHTGWFRLSPIAQVASETTMPRGIFSLTDVGISPPRAGGMELRGLTNVFTDITTLEWAIWDTGNVKRTLSIASLSADVWYFFTCGYDKVGKRMFLSLNNGTIQYFSIAAPPNPANTIMTNFAAMYCRDNYEYLGGASDRRAAPLQGYCCSMSRWNRLLSPSETAILYNGGLGKFFPFFP